MVFFSFPDQASVIRAAALQIITAVFFRKIHIHESEAVELHIRDSPDQTVTIIHGHIRLFHRPSGLEICKIQGIAVLLLLPGHGKSVSVIIERSLPVSADTCHPISSVICLRKDDAQSIRKKIASGGIFENRFQNIRAVFRLHFHLCLVEILQDDPQRIRIFSYLTLYPAEIHFLHQPGRICT